jgi:hypothetical protein
MEVEIIMDNLSKSESLTIEKYFLISIKVKDFGVLKIRSQMKIIS